MHFNEWKEWFAFNAGHFAHINWEQEDKLTAAEKKLIAKSLQQFQRGENSEGKHLYQFARHTGDVSYAAAIKLFIKEEQTHAVVLGKYLDKHHIPRIKNHWVDGVFRFLRKLSGIENSVRILLTAEIISKAYYAALQRATGSSILKLICEQILCDEIKHIHFQCCALGRFTANKHPASRAFFCFLHYILMEGTIAIVWSHHRKVVSAGNLSFAAFRKHNRQLFFECVKMINGKKEIPSAITLHHNRA